MSWPLVKLKDVAEINPRLPKNVDESQIVTFLPMAAVSEQGQILKQEKRILNETRKGFTYFEKNDVVVAKITPCFENGKAAYLGSLETQIGFGTTEFHVIRADIEKLDAKYLFYLVWNKWFRHLGERNMSGSGGQKRVPADFLKELEIPLPPLDEQKRIAAILDKADAIRRKRQQAIDLADDFLRSVFLDMFGDPVTNPKGWEVKRWSDVLKIVNGKNQKAVLADGGKYPIMGSGGEMGRASEYLTPENSVIIGRKGNINKPILVKENFWNVDTAFGLVPKPSILSFNYLYWFCKFFDFERLNKAVTIPSLTKVDLLQISIPLPDISKQTKFDQIVNQIELIVNKSSMSSQSASDIFNSLCQRAFEGKL